MIFCDYYLPGYKSGGGMRTIVNMVDRLHEKYDFWIVTRDHDGKLDKESYKSVKINQWNSIRNAQVYYLSKDNIKISKLRELILETKPDSLYSNSFFATLSIFVIKLRKLRLIPNLNIIIAPCGELSDGSLNLKPAKKQLYITVTKLAKIYKNVIWKASSELEKLEIERIKGKGGKIFISPDLPPKILNEHYSQDKKPEKNPNSAKMIFLSRFARKKNFKWLLEKLDKIKGHLIIDVYGPLEEPDYWEECLQIINKLPKNIKVEAKGSIPYEETANKLLEYHFFILPTLAENFGHVFLEALAAGCPLVMSDRTPWLNLKDKKIGWDISLEKPDEWLEILNHCINMNNAEFVQTSSKARSYAMNWLNDPSVEEETIKILNYSLSKNVG